MIQYFSSHFEPVLSSYDLNDATWFCLSLLLIVAVFFRFNRLLSLRNLDLLLLLAISPGLLFLHEDYRNDGSHLGYLWLFVCSGLLLLRLFLDSRFRRRPLLEQNLNAAGLGFLCVAAFAFQVTRVVMEPMPESTLATVHGAKEMLSRQDTSGGGNASGENDPAEFVPGPATKVVVAMGGVAPVTIVAGTSDPSHTEIMAARLVACLSHLAVVAGLILLGRRHLGDVKLGVAMATLYLLMPGTALKVSNVNHILPAAFVIWALVYYSRPMIAGCLMGLACGTVFFPAFLLPLWVAFYGRQGAIRFGLALGIISAGLLSTFALTAADSQSFLRQFVGSIDWSVMQLQTDRPGQGFWSNDWTPYRLPMMAGFVVMVCVLTIFPRSKNIEHLMAHSAAIVVGTQLWYPQGGGVYVLWYLPLVLAVVFRPRLTHLVPPESAPLLRAARERLDQARKERTFSSTGRHKLR
ncbi:MAG: hypothetical protein VB858_00920 [Planctomycetaceae bacterium]